MNRRVKKAVALFTAAAIWGSSIYVAAETKNVDKAENTETENTQTENIPTEDTQAEPGTSVEEETDDGTGGEGVPYYLNMKKNENLLKIYEETELLLGEKEKICQMMYEEGETTKLYADQVQTEKAGIQAKKQICTNEIRYDQYFLEEKDLHYKGIKITDDKSLGTIESCTAKYPDLDKFLVAGCVTDCENARANIQAQEAETAYLEQVYQNTLLLHEAGEASRLDVIDSRLSVLDASLQLQSLYYDMNVAYYTVVYGVKK